MVVLLGQDYYIYVLKRQKCAHIFVDTKISYSFWTFFHAITFLNLLEFLEFLVGLSNALKYTKDIKRIWMSCPNKSNNILEKHQNAFYKQDKNAMKTFFFLWCLCVIWWLMNVFCCRYNLWFYDLDVGLTHYTFLHRPSCLLF